MDVIGYTVTGMGIIGYTVRVIDDRGDDRGVAVYSNQLGLRWRRYIIQCGSLEDAREFAAKSGKHTEVVKVLEDWSDGGPVD